MTDHDQAAWTAAAHANRGNATYPPRKRPGAEPVATWVDETHVWTDEQLEQLKARFLAAPRRPLMVLPDVEIVVLPRPHRRRPWWKRLLCRP